MRAEIQYPEGSPQTSKLTPIRYVGGPNDGRREVVYEGVPPAAVFVPAERGLYQKSARCADDLELRYVWVGEDT